MRIIHHFTRLAEGSGVSRAVIDLAGLMARAHHDVTLLISADSNLPSQWESPRAAVPTVVALDPPTRPFERLSKASLARAAGALEDADILHLHGLWRFPNSQIASLARRMKVPYVISSHGMLDDWSMAQAALRKRLYYWCLERSNLASAQRVHVTAQAEADQSGKWIPHEKISVAPLAVDIGPFLELPEPAVFLDRHPEVDPARPSVLFLSRLHEKKGLDVLIDAIALVRERDLDCQLLIAGTGEFAYERHLRQLAAARFPDAVFIGLVTGVEKTSLYHHADLFALPTIHENFGLVFAESLAAGTPIITTRGTGIWKELQSSGASMIVDQTPEAFASAIGELLTNHDRRRAMGRQGRSWLLTWLEPRGIITRYEQLYLEALGRR